MVVAYMVCVCRAYRHKYTAWNSNFIFTPSNFDHLHCVPIYLPFMYMPYIKGRHIGTQCKLEFYTRLHCQESRLQEGWTHGTVLTFFIVCWFGKVFVDPVEVNREKSIQPFPSAQPFSSFTFK